MLRSCEGKTSRGTCIECAAAQETGSTSMSISRNDGPMASPSNGDEAERSRGVDEGPGKSMLASPSNGEEEETKSKAADEELAKSVLTSPSNGTEEETIPRAEEELEKGVPVSGSNGNEEAKSMADEGIGKSAESSQLSSLTSSTTTSGVSRDVSEFTGSGDDSQLKANQPVHTAIGSVIAVPSSLLAETSFDFCCSFPNCKADQYDECKVCTKSPGFCELHMGNHEHEIIEELYEDEEMQIEEDEVKLSDKQDETSKDKEAEVNKLWINKLCCSKCKLSIDSAAKSQKCATNECHRVIHVDCVDMVKNNGHCFDCIVLFPNKRSPVAKPLNEGNALLQSAASTVSTTVEIKETSPAETNSNFKQAKSVDLTIKNKKESTRKEVLKETYQAYLSAELEDNYATEADFFHDIQTKTKEERLMSLKNHNMVIQKMLALEKEQTIEDFFNVPATQCTEERFLTKIKFKTDSKFYCSEKTYFSQDDPQFPLTLLYGYWSCDALLRPAKPGHFILSYSIASHPQFKPNSIAVMRIVQTTCNAPWVGMFLCNIKSALSPSGPSPLSFQLIQNKDKATSAFCNELCCDVFQPLKKAEIVDAFRFYCANERILYTPKRHLKIDCIKGYYHDSTAVVLAAWEKQEAKGGKKNNNYFDGSFDPSIHEIFATQDDLNSGKVIIAVQDPNGGYITKKVSKAELSVEETSDDKQTSSSNSSSSKTRQSYNLGDLCRMTDLLEEKAKRRELAKENEANKASIVTLQKSVDQGNATITELTAQIAELEAAIEKLQDEAEEQTVKTSRKRGRTPEDITALKNKITQLKKEHNQVIADMNIDKKSQATILKQSQDAVILEKKRADSLQKQITDADTIITQLKQDAEETTTQYISDANDLQVLFGSSKQEIADLKTVVEEQNAIIAKLKSELAENEITRRLEKEKEDRRRSIITWKGMHGWQFINGLINGSIKSGDVEQSTELACCLQTWIKDGFTFADGNQGGTFQIQSFTSPVANRYPSIGHDVPSDEDPLVAMHMLQQSYDAISPNFQRTVQVNRQSNFHPHMSQQIPLTSRQQPIYIQQPQQQHQQYQIVRQQQNPNGAYFGRKRHRSNGTIVYQQMPSYGSNTDQMYM